MRRQRLTDDGTITKGFKLDGQPFLLIKTLFLGDKCRRVGQRIDPANTQRLGIRSVSSIE